MPQKEICSQFSIRVINMSGDKLHTVEVPSIDFQFQITKGKETILYVSTKKPISRQYFKGKSRGAT